MILRFIVSSFVLFISVECHKDKCVTGYMTEVQSWVDNKGVLTNIVDYHKAVDLSANSNPVPILQQKMTVMRFSPEDEIAIKYLSMARCRLTRVPTVFTFRDSMGRNLAETVEYITFYGNNFQDISAPGALYDVTMNATNARERIVGMGYQRHSNAVWSTGLREIYFPFLRELDLRACSIQVLSSHIFVGMPTLGALYIGENEIAYIDANAFIGLNSLYHLDFSRNKAMDDIGNFKSLTTETFYVFEHLTNLSSLDFSFTRLTHRHASMFKVFGPKLTRLSLCETTLTALDDDFFNQTSLRILDVSGNAGILSRPHVLRGLENTLEVLYAKEIGLRTVDIFKGLRNLEILVVAMNELSSFNPEVAKTFTSLKILELNKNRLLSWFEKIYSLMPNLELLSIQENNINVISDQMIDDIADVRYVALSGNFIVCNCHARDFFDLALRNEEKYEVQFINDEQATQRNPISYHTGFIQFNSLIDRRFRAEANCSDEYYCYEDLHEDVQGHFLLLDFHPNSYMCLQVFESKPVKFSEVIGCNRMQRNEYDKDISKSKNMLYTLLALPILLIILGVGYIFRRNIRYFYITMRNSALLSVINKNEVLDEDAIFHYDVFVSYCNEDRNWVLDHLLTHLEKDCSISACLHERDFQVGHSILENIVSCMDRSRSIMLIISQKFLMSQWCQFEMHLAQHRLLETRREDLTIVLLEEIPRRFRPNTLHYLMLTKTYIVWPKSDSERALFWKRLKKSIVTIKMKHSGVEGVSFA